MKCVALLASKSGSWVQQQQNKILEKWHSQHHHHQQQQQTHHISSNHGTFGISLSKAVCFVFVHVLLKNSEEWKVINC